MQCLELGQNIEGGGAGIWGEEKEKNGKKLL